MPWIKVKRGDEICIYKKDANGKPVGDSLGCHPSEEKADAQMAAMHANMGEAIEIAETALIESLVDSDGKLPQGSVWEVTPVAVGKSKRHPFYYYSQEALYKTAKNFEGVRVFAHRKGPHVEPSEKSVHDEVGWLSNAKSTVGRISSYLNILPSAT